MKRREFVSMLGPALVAPRAWAPVAELLAFSAAAALLAGLEDG